MIKNIFKIVFLGVVGFAALVYLTAPEERLKPNKVVDTSNLNVVSFPTHFELVNHDKYVRSHLLFPKGEQKYLIVLNHDSLAVFKDLHKFTDKNIILAANVSETPWIMKKFAVGDKLEELYKDSKIKLINDSNGDLVKTLVLRNNSQTKYFVYKVDENGKISKLFESDVKYDALLKGVTDDEIKTTLDLVVSRLK